MKDLEKNIGKDNIHPEIQKIIENIKKKGDEKGSFYNVYTSYKSF